MHTRRPTIRSFVASAAFALAVAACGGSSLPSSVPSIDVPTLAIIDQVRTTGADAPALLEANKDALISGLGGLDSSDPTVTAWRDALVDALEAGDFDAAADEVAKVANNEVTITAC